MKLKLLKKMTRVAILSAILFFTPLTSFAQGVSSFVAQAICADYDENSGKALIASASSSADALLVKGIVLHNMAFYYNQVYLTEALTTLEGLKALSLAQAYKGSAMTLVGRSALASNDIVKAADQTQKGLAILNQAQKSDPSSVWIHFLRLLDGIEVSRLSPFKQYDIIGADVEFLVALLNSGSAGFRTATGLEFDSELGKKIRAAMLFEIGEYWFDQKKVAKALEYWDKAEMVSSKSRYGKMAAAKLAQMEE